MDKDKLNTLRNVILSHQMINYYSREFIPEDRSAFAPFLSSLKSIYQNVLAIDIDSLDFEQCEDEEAEAKVFLDVIGTEWNKRGFGDFKIKKALSISDVLYKWGEILDLEKKTLLVFHFLHDLYNEKEKNILRSLRKMQRSKLSAYLKILMVSNRPVSKWQLFPESNLDERHVAFVEI